MTAPAPAQDAGHLSKPDTTAPVTPPATPVHTDHPLPASTAVGGGLSGVGILGKETDTRVGTGVAFPLHFRSQTRNPCPRPPISPALTAAGADPNNRAGLAETSPAVGVGGAGEGRWGPLVDPVHPSPPLVYAEGEPELITEEGEPPVYGEGEPDGVFEKVEPELVSEKVEPELVE